MSRGQVGIFVATMTGLAEICAEEIAAALAAAGIDARTRLMFAGKGAGRIAPLERHGASSGTLAEDEAGAWATGWAGTLALAA